MKYSIKQIKDAFWNAFHDRGSVTFSIGNGELDTEVEWENFVTCLDKTVSMKQVAELKARKFVSIDGFKDGTHHIEVLPNGNSWKVDSAGRRFELVNKSYPLSKCVSFVRKGWWREVSG